MADYLETARRVLAEIEVGKIQTRIDAAVKVLNEAGVRVKDGRVYIPTESDSLEVRRALDTVGMTFPRVRFEGSNDD